MFTLEKVLNFIFKGTIVILPLFFLPFNLILDGMDSFGKSFLLSISVFFLIVLLVYKKEKDNDNEYKMSYLGYLLLFFVVILSVSGIFGVYPRVSFWGEAGMTLSIMNYVSLFFLYFFIINYVKSEGKFQETVKCLLISYIISVWIVFLAFLLKWFGIFDSNSGIFSIINAQNGSFEDFSIYLAIFSIFILGLTAHDNFKMSKYFWFIKITWIVSFFLLVLINFIPAWLIVILSFVLFTINIYRVKPSEKHNVRYLKRVTALVFLLSFVMLLMNFTFTGQFAVLEQRQSANFQLDFTNSHLIVLESLKDNPMLGQGGENYKIAFSKYRDSKMNSSSWWDIRYGKSFSYVCDIVVATGLIGSVIFLFFVFSIFFYYIKMSQFIFSKKNVFLLPVFIIFSFFLYNTNIILLFIFVVSLGIMNFFLNDQSIKGPLFSNKLPLNFVINEDRKKYFMFVFGILLCLLFLVLAYRMKAVFAQMNFAHSQKTLNIEEKEKLLVRANNFNPSQMDYKIALGKFYKDKVDKIINENKELRLDSFEEELNLSIMAGKNAIALAPNSVSPYEFLGIVYRDIAQFSPDSNILSTTAFEKASELEPTNPVILLELAKLYSNSQKLDDAKEVLQKALSLKDDYHDARLFLARLMIERGEFLEALNELEGMEGGVLDVNVKYEIGRIFFNQKDYMKAKEKFSEVIKLYPTHSNALYSLALCYEKLNRPSEALVFYKRVLQLNPDNVELRKKVMEL